MKFPILLCVLIVIVTNVNGDTRPLIDDVEGSNLKPESSFKEAQPVHVESDHRHPGRKERCFFSKSSSSGPQPSLPDWQMTQFKRIQNFRNGQEPPLPPTPGMYFGPVSSTGTFQYRP